MNIALIAHDKKKELLVQFSIAYCGILSKHTLCATGTTGKMVSEATGLGIQRYLSGSQGGAQQIGSRIACDEIDLLLLFRDPLNPKPGEPNEANLLRLCDVYNVPVATNIATAEEFTLSQDRVRVEEREEGGLTVTNLTQTDIPSIRIFYKFYKYDTNVYIGGITYTSKVTDLAAGGSCVVTPSHYLKGYSKIIKVAIYDTDV